METSSNVIWKKPVKKKKLRSKAGRFTIAHVFAIKQLIEKTCNNGQEVHFTFVDMEKIMGSIGKHGN